MVVVFTGLLFIIVGLPFYLKMVPPNRISGVRVPPTLDNPETWYSINKGFGQDMIIAGVVYMIVAFAISYWFPEILEYKYNVWLALTFLGIVVGHTLLSIYVFQN